MKMPLFSLGEEVLLCSKSAPHLNGTAVIVSVVEWGASYICPHCGYKSHKLLGESNYGYFLNIISDENCCQPWAESALRKKPKPASKSFSELMEDCKQKENKNEKTN